jgi:hypothetical protein
VPVPPTAGLEGVILTPSSRQLGASVSGTSRDDPFVGLIRDLSNQFEVAVVMQHSKSAGFGGRRNKGIDAGERTMVAPGCKGSLDLQCSLVISVCGRYCGKRPQPVGDLPVVVGASGGVSEFECDRVAQSYLSSSGKWGESRGYGWLGQPCEDAGVDQIADACHLFVGAPGPFGLFEVEATVLGEQGD